MGNRWGDMFDVAELAPACGPYQNEKQYPEERNGAEKRARRTSFKRYTKLSKSEQ
jgi:hypothetical protein